MIKRLLSTGVGTGLATTLAAAVAACALAATTHQGGRPSSGATVALLLPENITSRYESQDRPLFVAAMRRLDRGASVDVANALGSPSTQQAQAEAALANGATVLVVDPVDSDAARRIATEAHAQGAAVIAYDRFIPRAPIDAFVSFDGYRVGQEQARWLVRETHDQAAILMIAGDITDDNARLFDRGAMSVLAPLFHSGRRHLVGHVFTPKWDPATAQQETDQALTRSNDHIDGVLVANDGMAGGVIAALKAQGLAGRVPVTGQDATVAGLQRILLGMQGETVLKDVRLEADAAARAAVAELLERTLPDLFRREGSSSVPTARLPVVSLDRDNWRLAIRAGAVSPRELCPQLPAHTKGCS